MEWYECTKTLTKIILKYKNNKKEFKKKFDAAYIRYCHSLNRKPQKLGNNYDMPNMIDPLSVFGLLSIQGPKNRKILFNEILKEFGSQPIKDIGDWDIPHITLYSLFYNFEHESWRRQIPILWDFFEIANEYSPKKDSGNYQEKRFAELFDNIVEADANNIAKTTIILFMINPQKYFSLDSCDISYLLYKKGVNLNTILSKPKFHSNFHYEKNKFRGEHYCIIIKKLLSHNIDFLQNAKCSNRFDYKKFKNGYDNNFYGKKDKNRKIQLSDNPRKPKKNKDETIIIHEPFKRDQELIRSIMDDLGSYCYFCSTHSFESKNYIGEKYVEAHHIIPFRYQSQFKNSLDNPANIVLLCPNCHKNIHFGMDRKTLLLQILDDKRINRLIHALGPTNNFGEKIDRPYILSLYNCKL